MRLASYGLVGRHAVDDLEGRTLDGSLAERLEERVAVGGGPVDPDRQPARGAPVRSPAGWYAVHRDRGVRSQGE